MAKEPAEEGINSYESPKPASQVTAARTDFDLLPTLYNDRSFWGMTITQFLGAFNDTVFKQIVFLLCATVLIAPAVTDVDKQFVAQAMFAIPFVLFSGIAGYWSDRVTKKWIIVSAKVGEIVVMLLAVVAFATMAPRIPKGEIYWTDDMPWFVLAVLLFMGLQSTIFGPSKYGVLPEMFRGADLPRCNGVVQMTTFIALIVGIWVGGALMDLFGEDLWKAGVFCVVIAIVGTATSMTVRRTPVAQPDAPFHLSALAVAPETWRMLRSDRDLRNALLVYSAFWFVAAIFPMAVNTLGISTFKLGYEETSLLFSSVALGIAAGFVVAGKISKDRVRFGLVRIGTWGLIVSSLVMSLPRSFSPVIAENGSPVWTHLLGHVGSFVALPFVGFFAGFFALPVQVFLQSRPPESLKGRMIGTMNLVNWVGIILAAVVFYPRCLSMLAASGLPNFAVFGATALVLLPVALFYHPRDAEL
jgi:acyl-[acyl-carrier-protein]-phospholipid O-acyltransferase/long-chain-fatty-acid--[acyl-carrier-protein] ligase